MTKLTGKKIAISALAVAAVVARIVCPSVKIDAVALVLIGMAILPWLTELIESAKFPGGWEIKLRDVASAGSQVIGAASKTGSKRPEDAYTFASVATQDPNLALAGLRIEIERRLRKLAERNGLESRASLSKLLRELRSREILSGPVASGLDDLIAAGNRAAHGATVEPEAATWAMELGPSILAVLDEELKETGDKVSEESK